MPWKKRIQPGEKLPLKLTEAQRTLVLDALTCLDSDCEKVVRETPAGEPVMMSLDDLDIFGGCLAADANHTEDRKLQGKLDTIFKKVQRLLDTYTDQEQDEAVAIERAKARIGRAVVLALADETSQAAPARSRRSAPFTTADQRKGHVYTLEVFLFSGGRMTEKFAKQNPVVSRTIQIRGDQTLEDLHNAIFSAFGRWDEHMYEFQFGKRPMDPKAARYVLPEAFDLADDPPPVGRVDETTIDSLGLKVGDRFGYWFDFGDDWWHQINVEEIGEGVPRGKFPKVIKRVGKNPPQYPDE
jgi:hypothetical protein